MFVEPLLLVVFGGLVALYVWRNHRISQRIRAIIRQLDQLQQRLEGLQGRVAWIERRLDGLERPSIAADRTSGTEEAGACSPTMAQREATDSSMAMPHVPRITESVAAPVAPKAVTADAAMAGNGTSQAAGAQGPEHDGPPAGQETQPKQPSGNARETFERSFGMRWSVWLGMAALMLGGVFLVKQAIDHGLLTPAVRILLGALFSALLLGLGEWSRRRELALSLPFLPDAHIPGALTSSGIVAGHATVLAAHYLYAMIGAPVAFVLMTALSLASLLLALRHGQMLAGLGFVGAAVAPVLLPVTKANPWLHVGYYTLVTAATMALATARNWPKLSVAALLVTLLVVCHDMPAKAVLPCTLFLLVQMALVRFLHPEKAVPVAEGLSFEGALMAREIWPWRLLLLGLLMSMAIAMPIGHPEMPSRLVLAHLPWLLGAGMAIATARLLPLQPLAAGLALVTMMAWYGSETRMAAAGTAMLGSEPLLTMAAVGALHTGLALFTLRRWQLALPAFASALLPPALFLLAAHLHRAFAHVSPGWAGAALVLGIFMAALAEADLRAAATLRGAAATARTLAGNLHAASAAVLLVTAPALALRDEWLMLTHALMVPAFIALLKWRGLPHLAWLALLPLALFAVEMLTLRVPFAEEPGRMVLFNWLLVGYGVPAVAMHLAVRLVRNSLSFWLGHLFEAVSIVCVALLAVFEVRHALNGGDVLKPMVPLMEMATHQMVMLSLSIGYAWFSRRSGLKVQAWASTAMLAVSMAIYVLFVLGLRNPLFSDRPLSQMALAYVYLLPAGLFLLRALAEAEEKISHLLQMLAGVAAAMWVTLAIRLQFHPRHPGFFHGATQEEWIVYSVVWLIIAGLVLAVGILLRQPPLRRTGLGLVALVTAKVFLSDLAVLEGIWRALSFIGLGLALIALGWLYQRLEIQDQERHSDVEETASADRKAMRKDGLEG